MNVSDRQVEAMILFMGIVLPVIAIGLAFFCDDGDWLFLLWASIIFFMAG